VAGICECGNEPSGSIKCKEFLDLLASQEGLCCVEFRLILFSTVMQLLYVLQCFSQYVFYATNTRHSAYRPSSCYRVFLLLASSPSPSHPFHACNNLNTAVFCVQILISLLVFQHIVINKSTAILKQLMVAVFGKELHVFMKRKFHHLADNSRSLSVA